MKTIAIDIEDGNTYPDKIENNTTLLVRNMNVKVQKKYVCKNGVITIFTQHLDEKGNVVKTA